MSETAASRGGRLSISPTRRKFVAWGKLACLAVLAIYFYIGMEWLFFATKPSFMDFLPLGTKLGIMLLPGLLITAASLPFLLLLFAASFLPWWSRRGGFFLGLGAALPAVFFGAAGLMMADNFTYTVLGFGIVHTRGVLRGLYGLLFLGFLGWLFWRAARQLVRGYRKNRPDGAFKTQLYTAGALLALSLPLGGSLFLGNTSGGSLLAAGEPERRPNILLIGTDGLDADKTSIYGDRPDTTPFLRAFAEDSLLALNNFPNANFTSGSLVSMFTSKLPTRTRVLYPPDILKGSDAFQHLPGILKQAGYYNAAVSVDYYADPNVLNLQDSFVMMNGRSDTIGRLYTFSRRYLPENAAYFLSMLGKRLSDRVFHIFYARSMPNPYAEVRQKLSNMTDQDRVGQIVSLFRDVDQPLFIHVHLMETHTNEEAIYRQGITNFDQNMRFLVNELDLMGRLEQTVVVVYTDHGYANVSHVRVPLLFRFPGGEHAGQVTGNTQNLDIAPTLLDYIGIDPPGWMGGQSLFSSEPPAGRPIFSAAPNFRADEDNLMQLDLSMVRPPFYQFGTVEMVVCQWWYAANTTTLTWQEGEVEGYRDPCPPGELPDTRQAQAMLLAKMKGDGFDVALLEEAFLK
jgi:hypothetical protein